MKSIGEVLAELSVEDREVVLLEIRTRANAAKSSAWADARRAFEERKHELVARHEHERGALAAAVDRHVAERDIAIRERDEATARVKRLTGPDAEQELAAERLRELASKNVGGRWPRW